jgi:hypothetical protein
MSKKAVNQLRREGAMGNGLEVFVGVAALSALAAFALYRWRMRERARRIKEWVTDYLIARHGAPLVNLRINCSDDPLWPVPASSRNPRTGARHSPRFACPGAPSTFALDSEIKEPRQGARGDAR